MPPPYPRDLIGYGATPPHAQWPRDARIALQFVINYEEGAENSILHGDPASEAFLSEIVGAEPVLGSRHMNIESLFEYGSRAGFWRLHRVFAAHSVTAWRWRWRVTLRRRPRCSTPAGRSRPVATAGSTTSTSPN
jgi:peptidoglycan/xylan/chitin deacetylase (PgdA/CDA1 family)